jgi:hypothetical protein
MELVRNSKRPSSGHGIHEEGARPRRLEKSSLLALKDAVKQLANGGVNGPLK